MEYLLTALKHKMFLHEVHEENNEAMDHTVIYSIAIPIFFLEKRKNPNILWSGSMALQLGVTM